MMNKLPRRAAVTQVISVMAVSAVSRPIVAGGAALNVLDFGAIPDGVHDNRLAFQEAVDELRRRKGGVLFVPRSEGTYRINGSVDLSLAHSLTILSDDAVIIGSKTTTFTTLPDGHTPFWEYPYTPLYSHYPIGTYVLDVDGAEERFRAQDPVLIRCGGTAPDALERTPIAEYNIVRSAHKNKLVLQFPTTKPFSFRPHGPFGIANVRRRVTRKLELNGLVVFNQDRRCCDLVDCIDLNVRNCSFNGRGAVAARGRFLNLSYSTAINADWVSKPLWRPYYLALDTGTSDAHCNIIGRSSSSGVVHIHEGVSNLQLRGDFVQSSDFSEPLERWPVISIRALSWNVTLTDLFLHNSPASDAIVSAESSIYPGEGNFNLEIVHARITGLINGMPLRVIGLASAPTRLQLQ